MSRTDMPRAYRFKSLDIQCPTQHPLGQLSQQPVRAQRCSLLGIAASSN